MKKRISETELVGGPSGSQDPREAAELTPADYQAFRNLLAGKATEAEQRRFIDWFIRASGFKELEFRDTERLSAFAGGKRWVAMQFFTAATSAITER